MSNGSCSGEALFQRWQRAPELFVKEALRIEHISNQQYAGLAELKNLVGARLRRFLGEPAEAGDAVYLKKMGLSIMSGRGTGKDAFASWAILWFLCCFPWPKIGCTAPTRRQLRGVLWAELHKWLKDAAIKDWVDWQAEKLFFKVKIDDEDVTGRGWFAEARTCKTSGTPEEQAETLSGLHEDFMMLLVDEASGVPRPVFTPLEGTMTGPCNFMVLIFNPTRSSGYAIDSQFKDREQWCCLRWNAEESDRVSPESIARIAEKYGKDSDPYRITVLGLPPRQASNMLIPTDWVMDCVEQELEWAEDDKLIFGLDIARGGEDESIKLARRGPVVGQAAGELHEYQTRDTELLTGWFMNDIIDEEPDFIMVDSIGIGGPVADKLRARVTGAQVFDVAVSTSASQKDKFERLRDELWWRVREKFEKRLYSIPKDDDLIFELTTIKYEPDRENGKLKIQSKKNRKAEGLASPNKADALMITEFFEDRVTRAMKKAGPAARRRSRPSWVVA